MPRSRSTKTSQNGHDITWQTEVLRVTAFPISGATIIPNTWKEITGNDPPEIIKQPPPMQSIEAGPFPPGRLSVGYQPGRIDLTLTPDVSKSTGGIAHIGDFHTAMEQLLPVAKKMFKPDMVMQRLAIGAVLLNVVASPEDGYKLIRSILPVARGMPENGTDFFLQLNVPITIPVTGIADIPINRLVKWHGARMLLINMIGGAGVPTQMVNSAQTPVVRVELDMNTPADLPVVLSHQNILELIDHLAAQARAIAANAGWFPE